MLPSKQVPVGSLSIQSFHDDSPPFTGAGAGESYPPPPAFDLSSSVSNLYASGPPTPSLNGGPSSSPQPPATPSSALNPAASSSTTTLTGPGRPSSSPPPVHRAPSTGEIRHAKDGEADKEALLDPNATPNVDSGRFLAGDEAYTFPRHRLKDVWEDESKIPLVIVACGSFSPPTYLHLRMFEMAKDQIEEDGRYEILGGYYSPVSDHYKKAGLAPATDRVKMCELGVETTSMWLMVDPWEAGQDSYQRTAVVLQHFEEEINGGEGGGVRSKDGKHARVKIMLLAGGDLIESFGHPGVWAEDDLHIILGHFGCLIIERTGSDVWAFLLSHDILHYYRKNIIVVKQLIYNDISSTKVRLFVRRGMSIKYLLPNSVISYILERGLYRTAPYTVPLEITPTTTPAPPHNIPTPEGADEDKQFFVEDASPVMSPSVVPSTTPSVSRAGPTS